VFSTVSLQHTSKNFVVIASLTIIELFSKTLVSAPRGHDDGFKKFRILWSRVEKIPTLQTKVIIHTNRRY
jgi:hypothetical protein